MLRRRRGGARAADLAFAARALLTAGTAVVGGLLGQVSGLPAGTLLGAMLAVAALNIATDGGARLPAPVRHGSRVLTGATIGSLVTGGLVASLGGYLPYVLAATLLTVLAGLGCGWLLGRLTGLDRTTALLACAPGGLPEMSALAQDLDAEVDLIVGLHVLRKVLALVVISLVVVVVGP